MPRAKNAEAVQNRYWEATRNGEVDSEVAKALGRLDNLFVKLYQSGATNRYVSTVSDEMADLDTYTDTMENYLGTDSEQDAVDTVNSALSRLHSNLMEALNSESPEAGKNCYQWLVDEAKKDGQDFVADMKTFDSITGLGWEPEQPQVEEQPAEEQPKVEEQKVEEQPKVEEEPKVEEQPVEQQPVEEQPKVEEPPVEQQPVEEKAEEIPTPIVEASEKEAQEKEAEAAQKPVTMQDYLLGKAGESIKAALDLIPDSPDWGDEKEKEEVFRHLSTARAAAYFAQRPDIAPRTIEGTNLENRLGEMEMWANMQMHGQRFRGAFDSETPQGIKDFLTDPEKEGAPVSPAELLERYNERIKDVVITVGVEQAPWLNNEQPEQEPEQAPEEQAPEQEAQPELAGLGMDKVANQLYTELAYLSQPLSAAYGNEWYEKVLDAQQLFLEENYKDSNGFKKSVEEAQKFLDTRLSDDKTIADFAKENKLLGDNFEKLMNRAAEIASMERQAEEEQPEEEQPEEEQPEAEEEQPEAEEEQPEAEDEAKQPEAEDEAKQPEAEDEAEQPEAEDEAEQPEAEEEQEQPELTNKRSADLNKPSVSRPPVQQTAAKWIESYKTLIGMQIKIGNNKGSNYPEAFIARIMAARELSKSVRGKASTLGVEMDEHKIADRAAKIMANESFKDFAAELKKPENLRKVEAIFTKKHSHGGELDDMFREHLRTLPAGKLDNDPDLKRWMPTVKQRIEALQGQAQKSLKAGKEVYREAVEIITLRVMVGAKRGGEGLNVPVPVRDGKNGVSLSEKVITDADLQKNREAFDKADGAKYICSGHGGKMIENIAKMNAGPDKSKTTAGTTVNRKTVDTPEHTQEDPRISAPKRV